MSQQTLPSVKSISQGELYKMLAAVKGASFATIVTETDPRFNKFGRTKNAAGEKVPCPYPDVMKVSTMNITINFIYANSVNRAQVKEGAAGDFEAAPRKWGERIKGTPFVMHDGKLYLEAKANALPSELKYVDTKTGAIVAKSLLEDYLPVKKSNAAHQGVSEENEVIVRDFMLTSIKEIKMNGEHFAIK